MLILPCAYIMLTCKRQVYAGSGNGEFANLVQMNLHLLPTVFLAHLCLLAWETRTQSSFVLKKGKTADQQFENYFFSLTLVYFFSHQAIFFVPLTQ